MCAARCCSRFRCAASTSTTGTRPRFGSTRASDFGPPANSPPCSTSPVVETHSDVTLPVPPAEAFEVISDLEHADWLPAVRALRHISGPKLAPGARYEVEVGFLGKRLKGVLACTVVDPPRALQMQLEEGFDLTITVLVRAV